MSGLFKGSEIERGRRMASASQDGAPMINEALTNW
jgi:hypothetical protein